MIHLVWTFFPPQNELFDDLNIRFYLHKSADVRLDSRNQMVH